MTAQTTGRDTASRWLDPQVVSSLESLEFLATQVVEGFITGLHTSPYRGYNQEFAEHRPYQAGDELRYLDWKLYGRTDRFYVKQFEADTNLRATLVLDASASMDFSGMDPPHAESDTPTQHLGPTKFDYARTLSACLAYLLMRQRDATGLALFQDRISTYIPARSSANHLRNLMQALDEARPQGETSLAESVAELALRLSRRGLIVVVSDLIDDPSAVLEALKLLRHQKHEVIVFHIMDRQEIELDYEGGIRFRNPEGYDTIDSDPVRLREDYRERIEAIQNEYRNGCLEHHIGYECALTDIPLESLLPAFLTRRRAGIVGEAV